MRPPSSAIVGLTDPIKFTGDFEAFRPSPDRAPPTVLQILPALVSGGVERGTVEIVQALTSAGWRALVVSSGGPMVREVERAGGKHLSLPVHAKAPWRWRSNIDALTRIVKERAVDLIHARSRMPAWIALAARGRTETPLVTTFHGRHPDTNPAKKIYNSVLTKGDRVIAISHYTAGDIAQRFNFDHDKLRIIQRGVDLNLFDPDRVSAERMINLAQEWRLPDGVPVIMQPGRVTRWKGHGLLIEALAELSDLDFRVLFVGNSGGKESFKTALETQGARLGVADRLHFVGTCRDMPAAYKVADVVVSPTLTPEPFGRTVVEAQAMGRPVVVSDHGGHRETVIDGETGWRVAPNDAAALAAALRAALSLDERRRGTMADAGIANARDHFSNFDMCARTLSVYRELLTDANP